MLVSALASASKSAASLFSSSSSLERPPGHSLSYEAMIRSGSSGSSSSPELKGESTCSGEDDGSLLGFSVGGDDESDSSSVAAVGLLMVSSVMLLVSAASGDKASSSSRISF